MIRTVSLLFLIALIWLLNNSFKEIEVEKLQVAELLGVEEAPDYYSENLQLREYNEQGELQSLIETTRLSHYSDQQQVHLESPKLVMYGIEGDTWQVTSASGEIHDNSRNLTLFDNVKIKVTDNNKQQKVLIKTSQLHYDVSRQSLWTKSKVSAESPLGNFHSTGLHMNLKTEELELKEKVEIFYDI